ncbi:MAG: hypothetical protein P1V97_25880 [Planctomycetota bacterium]|nr:hypothetical protein [Planctomycetota bacterium]
MKISFNSHVPTVHGCQQRQASKLDFPSYGFKYACLDFARPYLTEYVREMIDKAPISGGFRHVLLDVKVHDLRPGQYPCLPGWHCDGFIDPRQESRGERHHLFVSGQGALTEFLDRKVELTVPPGLRGKALLHSFRKQLRSLNWDAHSIPSCQWVQFGRRDFHRGPRAKRAERRLLIRITESDVLRPNKRIERYTESRCAAVYSE